MSDALIQQRFDYDCLDAETCAFIQEQEAELDVVLKRTSKEIGAILLKVKQRLPHGHYMPWLASRGISRTTAWRCMQVAQGKEADKCFKVKHLSSIEPGAIPKSDEPLQQNLTPQQFLDAVMPGFTEWEAARPAKTPDDLPATWNHVNGKPFTAPLPDGKPVVIPESWKLPQEMRGAPVKSAVLTALQSSESNEWYTPVQYIQAAKEVMGAIDVDPASCAVANKTIDATTYYDSSTDGLCYPWPGRVWLNPPYGFAEGKSNQEIWSHRLIEQYTTGITTEAILLVNANTEARWFQPLYDYLICLTHHRIRFYNSVGESTQPTQGNALIYFGKHQRRFIECFRSFGRVIREVNLDEY